MMSARYWLWPALGLLFASLGSQFTSINLLIVNQFYNVAAQQWRFAQASWLTTQLHDRGRDLIVLVFLVCLGYVLLSLIPQLKWHRYRCPASYLLLCIVVTTGLVAASKRFSEVDCPSDVKLFGGTQDYVHLFSDKPLKRNATGGGHCFPGGHSSGAFSLYGLYFLMLIYKPRHARKMFYLVTVMGCSYALTQWVRGAHFPIHDIWSGVIGWYVALTLAQFMLGQLRETFIVAPTESGS